MLITWQALFNMICSYAKRDPQMNDADNFQNNIYNFVNMGIDRIYKDIEDPGMDAVSVNGNFEKNNNVIAKSLGAASNTWDKTLSFSYGFQQAKGGYVNSLLSPQMMYERSYEFCQFILSPSSLNVTLGDYAPLEGPPLFYCDDPEAPYDNLLVFPYPDLDYAYTIVYRQKMPMIAEDEYDNPTQGVATNWLFQREGSLLFYASYIEALAFLRFNEQIPTYENMYRRCLERLSERNRSSRTNLSSLDV